MAASSNEPVGNINVLGDQLKTIYVSCFRHLRNAPSQPNCYIVLYFYFLTILVSFPLISLLPLLFYRSLSHHMIKKCCLSALDFAHKLSPLFAVRGVRSVCNPTLSSWGFGGCCKPPAGPGTEPRKQTHCWQQSIENWLKIKSLTSHVGKHESTYFNN